MKPINRTGLLSLAVASIVAMTSGPAWAQDPNEEGFIEEIVTTGTRREGQSPTETLSPIDVLGGEAFVNQSTFDVTDALTKIAPSLNTQRFPIADGTAVIRPVTLRNMSPDQTLVLGGAGFERPVVNQASMRGLELLAELHQQPDRRTWFCGSYAARGIPLLESAATSSLAVADLIGDRREESS